MNKKFRYAALITGLAISFTVAAQQQPLWNLSGQNAPATVEAQADPGVASQFGYAPQRPPEVSNPGVLEAPEIIARGLNENDAMYTSRMQQRLTQEQARTSQLVRRHEDLLKRIEQGLPIDSSAYQMPLGTPSGSSAPGAGSLAKPIQGARDTISRPAESKAIQ